MGGSGDHVKRYILLVCIIYKLHQLSGVMLAQSGAWGYHDTWGQRTEIEHPLTTSVDHLFLVDEIMMMMEPYISEHRRYIVLVSK